MTIIFECGAPFWWKPEKYESDVLRRYWWGWFAVSILKVPFREFAETAYRWGK